MCGVQYSQNGNNEAAIWWCTIHALVGPQRKVVDVALNQSRRTLGDSPIFRSSLVPICGFACFRKCIVGTNLQPCRTLLENWHVWKARHLAILLKESFKGARIALGRFLPSRPSAVEKIYQLSRFLAVRELRQIWGKLPKPTIRNPFRCLFAAFFAHWPAEQHKNSSNQQVSLFTNKNLCSWASAKRCTAILAFVAPRQLWPLTMVPWFWKKNQSWVLRGAWVNFIR